MFIYVRNRVNPDPRVVLLPDAQPVSSRVLVPYLDAPLMVLPRDEAGLRALRGGSFWRKRAAEGRKFERDVAPLCFETHRDPDPLQEWLPKTYELFRERWRGQHSGSEWTTAQGFAPFADAMTTLAPRHEASLSVLYRGDTRELLAYGYLLETERCVHFFQHATHPDERYRPYRLGQAFLCRLIQEVVASGRFDAFDFMIGTQPYKLEWASCLQRTWRVVQRGDYANAAAFRAAVIKVRSVEAVRRNRIAYAALKGTMTAAVRLRRPDASP